MSREELDDVHPRIQDVDDPLVKRSKWLWVMPLYMDDPISNHPEWVARIKNTGKILGLHGVKHTYNEFGYDLSEDYIQSGIDEFTKAFGYPPRHFKAPKISLTKNNEAIIRKHGMDIKGRFNQIIHQAHHNWNGRMTDGTNRLPGEYYTHGEDKKGVCERAKSVITAYLGLKETNTRNNFLRAYSSNE
jgi:peptidoglycan/xylan/chitin deacetylase (PgdA/CDA1 family)